MARPSSPAEVGVTGPLRVRLIGGLDVEGLAPAAIGSRKARTALRLLAVRNGRPVTVDQLADAVWPERVLDGPAKQLAVLVSRLRRVLGRDRIVHLDGSYRLAADWTDLEEVLAVAARLGTPGDQVSEAAREAASGGAGPDLGRPVGADRTEGEGGRLDEVRRALGLVRGPLLPEEVDAPWIDQERRVLERAVARLRHRGAELALAADDPDVAVDLAGAALADDPFDEAALRALMVAEQRRGSAGAGLAAYARVRERLADELGASPSAETEAVHEALLAEEPSPRRPDPPPLDADDSSAFVGREAELARLEDEVNRARLGGGRLTVVDGEAGIGKSTLVVELGRRVRAAGDTWLEGRCDPVLAAMPWQPVVDALADHLRERAPIDQARLLAGEQALLGPLLGVRAAGGDDPWLDASPGPLRVLAAFEGVVDRLTTDRPAVLVVEDLHRAGPSTIELLRWLDHRCGHLAIVGTRRSGQGEGLGDHVTIRLGPLDADEVVRLVGAVRAAELAERSGGNPLFLTQLASAPGSTLPVTLVDLLVQTADDLGAAGDTLATAAVLGDPIDLDLLGALLALPPRTVIAHLEAAVQRLLLVTDGEGYRFRHEVVRDALAGATPDALARRIHRDAASVLASRPAADPLAVAHHAQEATEPALAADALVRAADLAALRFDRAAAEALLTEAIALADGPDRRVARARARTMRGRYDEALADVTAAVDAGGGAVALEAGAWAAYFARRFDESRAFADDAAVLADDPGVRASCLTVAARVRHASGDLAGAEPLLLQATAMAGGADRAASNVWLGVLRAHQNRLDDALALLRPITRFEAGGERTNELLHALLFLGHALALDGRPVEALDALARYDQEVARRDVPRFAGRGANFSGWVRRALGQWDRADDENGRAVDEIGTVDFPETVVAARLDLASGALLRGRVDEAAEQVTAAAGALRDGLTFGWRLRWRHDLLAARVALAADDPAEAARIAGGVASAAPGLGVPRYAAEADLLVLRARAREGDERAVEAAAALVPEVASALGIDAWWALGEAAADLPPCREEALAAAARLARAAGDQSADLPAAVQIVVG